MYIFSMPLGIFLLLFVFVTIPSRASSSFEQIAKQADAARSTEHLNDAIHLYREALRLRPSWADGWWSLGSVLYDQDRFPEAEYAFRHLIASTPKRGPADAFLGLCEYETREYDRALAHFRAWATAGWSGTPQLIDVAVFHFALLLTRDGKFVQALYLLAMEASKLGENPFLAEGMGLASLRMRNLPEDYAPEKREMVWLAGEAAVHAAQSGDELVRADEFAAILESRYPQQPEVHYFRGTLFTFESKTSEAEHEYRAELQVSPQHVPAMTALAGIDLDNSNLSEATSLATQAAALGPEDPEAHHVLGRALMASGQLPESARELEIAKKLAPDTALVRSHLAMVYSRMGRTQAAKTEATAFLALKKKEGVLAPPQEKLRSNEKEKAQ
jgi:tetratricopeptide (TPR) repeat protein